MMMEEEHATPKVSVIIPLYNQERYFNACMRSVCRQTYKNLEIIVVNDGSTDCSPQIAQEWVARDVRVKAIDKQNEGTAFARRNGYLTATGEFITFVDSDDMLPSKSIELMVAHCVEKNLDLIVGSYGNKIGPYVSLHKDKAYSFPVNQTITQPTLFDEYYEAFFRTGAIFPIMACAKMYRKCVIDRAYQETELFCHDINLMGEDLYFNMKVFPYLQSMYRTDENVYYYRQGGGTFGHNKNFPQLFPLSDKRLEMLDRYDYKRGYEPLFVEYVAHLYHHAAQVIYYQQAPKDEVISFFEHEMNHRELMPRLLEFYSQCDSPSQNVRFLMDRDFDGMYEFACRYAQEIFGSFKYRLFSFGLKLLERLS